MFKFHCGFYRSVSGFINLNKPAGWTSHDCVAKVRRLLSQKRVGHGGTLDPAAEGVLPLAVGRATRLLTYLSHEKAYQATIRFGLTTTTDDLEGEVLTTQPAAHLTLAQVQAVLPQFIGTLDQVPPQYSAVLIQGKRAYDLARAGQTVEVPMRTVTVHHIEVLGWRSHPHPELDVAIACSAGTYIRSIARDLGACLQTGAALAHLLRTHSSGFDLASSQPLEQLSAALAAHQPVLLPPDMPLTHLPALHLDTDLARRWQQGQKIAIALDTPQPPYRVYHHHQFLGISDAGVSPEEPESVRLRPRVVYAPDLA
jgi:tRNA pseudouridine55 synthase